MKINVNWSAKSSSLINFIRENRIGYPTLCNAVNSRLDKVEFDHKDAAKIGKAKLGKKDGGSLKWRATQAYTAEEMVEAYDAPAMLFNFDIEAAKLEKTWGKNIAISLAPEGELAKWLLRFKMEKEPAPETTETTEA